MQAPDKPKLTTAYKYLAFFVLLNYLNMVDRNLLSAFAPSIVDELNLSDTQFGLLTGLIFVTIYAITGLFMGAMADRYHRPRIVAAGLTLWSALTAFTGVTTSFIQIAFARMFIGVGESSLTPTAISILSDLFPPEKRGMATGIYYFGVPIGAGSSYILAGVLGPIIGWRNCFFLLGGIGFLFVIVLLLLKDPKRGQMDQGNKSADIAIEPFSFGNAINDVKKSLSNSRALVFTLLGIVALNIPLGAGAMEILWLTRERGYSESDAQKIFGALFMLSGTVAALFGAFVSDWYHARFKGGRIRFVLICLILLAPILAVYRFIEPDTSFFYIAMCLGFVFASFSYGPMFATVQDLTPVPYRATMLGFLLLVGNILGGGGGAGGVGILSDYLREVGHPEPLSMSLFVASVFALSAIPFLVIATLSYEKDVAKIQG